jgi:hypothetical protein
MQTDTPEATMVLSVYGPLPLNSSPGRSTRSSLAGA